MMYCKTCHFWAGATTEGTCEQYPPVLLTVLVPDSHGDLTTDVRQERPTTDYEYCGEW